MSLLELLGWLLLVTLICRLGPITYPCCCGGGGPPPPPNACCPGVTLPGTLLATITGSCAGQYALNWNATFQQWITYAPIGLTCPNSGKYSLGLGCVGNVWYLFVNQNQAAETPSRQNCNPLFLYFECVLELAGDCGCSFDNPCVLGTGTNNPTVTITLLPSP